MFLSCQGLRDEADSFGRSFRDVRGSSEQLRRFVWHTRHAEPLRNEQFSFLPSNNRRCGVLRSSPAAQSACSQQRRCRCHSSTLSDRRLCTHRLCVGGDNGLLHNFRCKVLFFSERKVQWLWRSTHVQMTSNPSRCILGNDVRRFFFVLARSHGLVSHTHEATS